MNGIQVLVYSGFSAWRKVKYLAARKLYTVVSSVVTIYAGVGHTPQTSTKNFSPA